MKEIVMRYHLFTEKRRILLFTICVCLGLITSIVSFTIAYFLLFLLLENAAVLTNNDPVRVEALTIFSYFLFVTFFGTAFVTLAIGFLSFKKIRSERNRVDNKY